VGSATGLRRLLGSTVMRHDARVADRPVESSEREDDVHEVLAVGAWVVKSLLAIGLGPVDSLGLVTNEQVEGERWCEEECVTVVRTRTHRAFDWTRGHQEAKCDVFRKSRRGDTRQEGKAVQPDCTPSIAD